MHLAVGMRSLPMVRLLQEFNADARIKNIDGVSVLEIVSTENVRDIKSFLAGQRKYKDEKN